MRSNAYWYGTTPANWYVMSASIYGRRSGPTALCKIGGIGGVITRQGSRNKGYASAAMRVAVAHMKEKDGADFGLLFCEPHNFAFYRGLDWRQFAGPVFAEQPAGRVRFDVMAAFVFDLRHSPQDGALDLCGLPW